MRTLAEVAYLDSRFGVETDLQHAGSSLENPYVYDSSARDLRAMAERGLIEITAERTSALLDDPLIEHLRFKRLR